MLQLRNITLHRGDRLLFDGLDLTLHHGHKIGIVGRNGVGKSTLLALARDRILPEEGDVVRPSAWRVAWLDQHVQPSARSALDFVLDGDGPLRRVERAIAIAERDGDDDALGTLYSDYEDVGGYDAEARAGEILGGLGFSKDDFAKPHRAFSGGWRIRLNLAQALMTPSDLLLLDEPTNHLDLEATVWLESWVRKYPGTLAMVAHDRDFLDRTVQRIAHLERGQAAVYVGDYSSFERQRAEALTRQAALHKKQQLRVAEIQRFVDRFRAKESKARQVQSRLKALEKLTVAVPLHAESPYRFTFTAPRKISNPILQLDDAALGYDSEPVLRDATLRVYPNDRIGVLGANGAGKTTLLRCLAGEIEPLAGALVRGRHSAVGYFAQHQLESLDLARTPNEHLDETAEATGRAFTSQQAADYLGGWGFRGDDARRPACTFSGGEKARLVLALIACQQPAVLVLDEPTNHLDLEMREALALALQQYEGALLLVSHDRHLLRRSVDSFWLIANHRVQPFNGDLDDYASLRPSRNGRSRTVIDAKPRRRGNAQPLLRKQRDLEAEIAAQTKRVEELDRSLADPALHGGSERLSALAKSRQEAAQALTRCEDAWLAVQEELDGFASANENAGREVRTHDNVG